MRFFLIEYYLCEGGSDNNLIIKLEKDKKKLTSSKVNDYSKKFKNLLSFEKPDNKLLASIIDKIEIDENKNIDIYYKIKR